MLILLSSQMSPILGLACLLLLSLALLLLFCTSIMEYLKKLLLKAIEMVDAGECEGLTQEDFDAISEIIHRPISVGREDAAKFLGVSLNEFHRLRDEGVIPLPMPRKGFKEKEYFMSDLKKAKDAISKLK